MKTKKKQTNQKRRSTSRNRPEPKASQPFIEHAHELRRRLYFIAASVLVWGSITYTVQQHIVNILLRPAHGQHFIYTSPGGGLQFLFSICIYSGFIASLPVIVYHILGFFEPLLTSSSRRFTALGTLISGLLAAVGIIFGYYVGLPDALHFLLHQFTTAQIQPLVTIQSYFSFVIVYMVGSAMIFQLPLLLIFINRIKPLQPKRLLHYERWVILAAFVLAGLMNPTPNPFSQLLVAGPFILMYQIGILIIYLINRPQKIQPVRQLFEQDQVIQEQRQERELQPVDPLSFSRPQLSSDPPFASTTPVPAVASRPSYRQPFPVTSRPVRSLRPSTSLGYRQLTSGRPVIPYSPTFMDYMPPQSARSPAPEV